MEAAAARRRCCLTARSSPLAFLFTFPTAARTPPQVGFETISIGAVACHSASRDSVSELVVYCLVILLYTGTRMCDNLPRDARNEQTQYHQPGP